jgi:hypothetical protein
VFCTVCRHEDRENKCGCDYPKILKLQAGFLKDDELEGMPLEDKNGIFDLLERR